MAYNNLYGRQVKGGTLSRRLGQVITPPPPPVVGVPQDISSAVYRPALTWKADYSTQAAMIASYSSPDQDIKLATPGASLTLVDDPLNPTTRSRKWMKTTQPNGTATTNGVTDNPRMQIEDPRLVVEGDAFWTAFTIFLPSDWPVVGTTQGFIQIWQFYGEPFGGGATITLTFRADGTFDTPDILRWGFNRDNADLGAQGLGWKWQTQRARYVDIAMRVEAGRDKTGSVEFWLNTGTGWVQQTLLGGVTRIQCATIGTVNTTGPNSGEPQLYRRLDAFPQDLVHYISGHARGQTLASVDPHSYDGTWDTPQPPPPPPPPVGPESDLGNIEPTGDNVGAGKMPVANRPYPTIEVFGDQILTGSMTLRDRIVHGRVICNGANLVENCVIDGGPTAPSTGELYLVSCSGGSGSTIRYCNVYPQVQSPRWQGIGSKFYTAEYNNVWRCTDSFGVSSSAADGVTNVQILGNYSPTMTQFRPDIPRGGTQRQETHNDVVQLQGNRRVASDIIIRGNSFDAVHGASYAYGTLTPIVDNQLQLAAIMVTPNTQSSCSATIDKNWFRGGIYTVNAGGANPGILIITGNRFERPPGSNPTIAKSLVIDSTTSYTASGNLYLNTDGTVSTSAVTVTSG